VLIDLLSPANYIMINRNAINTLGLNTAVYCSELLTIYKKVVTKKKFVNEDNYFQIDRIYIKTQTTLNEEDQLKCDLILEKVGIIKRDTDNVNIIYFDVEAFSSLLACEDIKILNTIKNTAKVKVSKKDKEESMLQKVKEAIITPDYDIMMALRDWIDSMYTKRPVNRTQLALFQKTLNDYCKGDKQKTIEIINIASIRQYIDCSWAIKVYEDSLTKPVSNINSNNTRVTAFSSVNSQRQTKNVGSEVF